MQPSHPDNRLVDLLLRDHQSRMEEASTLSLHRAFHRPRANPHVDIDGVTSTRKRAPSLSTEGAKNAGRYSVVLKLLESSTVTEVSQNTDIPASTIRDARKRLAETGSPDPRKRGRKEGSGRIFTNESLEGLQDFIDTHPSATIKDMQKYLDENFGINPEKSTISKLLANMKITNKKIVKIPCERNTPTLAQQRVEWAITWKDMERAAIKFVYIDESGFNLNVASGKGWAIVGLTPEVEVPNNRGQNVSLLAALIPGRRIESYMIRRGSITSELIVEWMETNLFPLIRKVFERAPVVIVMDNARCHGAAVQECIVRNGYRYLKTVPYSPQTNPIERVFSQVKSFVSRRVPSDGNQLIEQIKSGVESVTEDNTWKYLKAHWSVMKLIQRGFLLGSDHVINFIEE